MITNTAKNKVKTTVETASECDVVTKIQETVEKALQEAINQCSKDYFRNIKAVVNIDIN